MTSTENVPSIPAWTVTGQSEQTVIGANGQAINVMQVTFTLPDGTSGSVNVPLTAYSVDNVRQAINAKAATLSAVSGLQG